ncbi:MAG: pilus assembly protein [Gammaproteobacteria bacterium]
MMDATFMDTFSLRGFFVASACFSLTLFSGQAALADDTEIFFGQNAATGQASNPNVLLILDSSGSMSASVADDPLGRDRMEVMQDVANDFVANMENVNIGLMRYDIRVGSGDAYADGGMVTHEVAEVESNRVSLTERINDIVHAGNTPLQETYLESAYYWMGAPALFGVNAYDAYLHSNGYYYNRYAPSVPESYVSGTTTYESPIIGACQRNYSVYITDGLPTTDINGTALITNLINDPTYSEHETTTCTNPDGFTSGGECVEELAEFLYANDFNDDLPGKQNVVSHFIGFALDAPFLQRAATAGGGTYYPANDADTLRNALGAIFNNVADDVNGFTAPAVTVNDFDRTTHLDELYFTVFQPSDAYNWDGNVKKYKYTNNDQDDGLSIIGMDDEVAVNPLTGFFYDGRDQLGNLDPNTPTAWSYWSSAPDGAQVSAGGAADELTVNRNVWTNAGGGTSLSRVSRDNETMRERLLNKTVPYTAGEAIPWPSTANDDVVDRWLDWAAGIDSYDANGNGSFTDARRSMGDPLHSKPIVVTYGSSADTPETVLYVGTNEGYLQAVSGSTGEELFSFMPDALWDNIPYMAENPKLGLNKRRYGLDGSLTVWKDDGGDGVIDAGDKVRIYVGMRRGGGKYYAFDVTDTSAPKLEWVFSNSQMIESWSTPTRAKVNFGTTDSPNVKTVLIVGGGYDPVQDSKTSYSYDPNEKGNAIFMINAETGALEWSASNTNLGATRNTVVSKMKNAVPSSVRAIDLDLDGSIDRMYATDIVGRLMRFDVHNEDSFEITGGVIAELGGTLSSSANNNRRFFYAPDVTLSTENGTAFLTITLSSGHRAHPLETVVDDYLFGIRDYIPFEVIGDETDDYDYEIAPGDLTTLSATSTVTVPAGAAGFKFPLTLNGEKSLARSRVFDNTAYYTAYTPGSAPTNNPCAPAVGSGALYTIDLTTGLLIRDPLQKAGIPPEATFLFGAPPEEELVLDNCFGPHCPSNPDQPDPDDTCDSSSDDCEFEETRPGGTNVQCQLGAEACDAGGRVRPTRTYWRQLDETG